MSLNILLSWAAAASTTHRLASSSLLGNPAYTIDRVDRRNLESLCGSPAKKWPSHRAITTLKPPENYGTDPRTEPFAMTIMRLTARNYAFQDDLARKAYWQLLDRWADGKAMTKVERDPVSARYSLQRTLLPVIISLVQSSVNDTGLPENLQDKRRRVVEWVRGLVEDLRIARKSSDPDDLSSRNNHALLYASVIAAWASFANEAELMEEAGTIFKQTVAGMRPDGSLPLETQRGARALWYQRHAIASMIVIAEIAAAAGIDLYGYDKGGKNIHLAIRFLIDAVENPRIVEAYARANVNPGPFQDYRIQDLGFMRPRGHGRHYMAWYEIYRSRFPDRPEARDLKRLLDLFSNDYRPMIDEYSGGNTSCFYLQPVEASNGQKDKS